MLGFENQKEKSDLRTVGKGGICKYWKGKVIRSNYLRKISLVAIGKTVWGEKKMDLGRLATIQDNDSLK